ncbi:hypothetical protein [Pseudomonas sp. dw_612]|uniref:hypothetical protein n=1 Tax=Pseudomonas sp. dw_612 TaxID=2720080 RepID=UPI001BD4B98B|nr:hypothetical protein [Pseudomonas sp. dw_612]
MFKGLCRLTGVVVLLCSTFSSSLWAQNSAQVFTGTLGKTPIVLEMYPDTGTGRYFYQKYRKDLVLNGKKEGAALVLKEGEEPYGEDQPRPTIRLQPTPDGWAGEWISPEGKVLKIELQPAKRPTLPANTLPYLARLHDQEPYEYLRLQGLKLKQGRTETFNGYSLQWWSEPQTKLAIFEVVSGYTPEARDRINQRLMESLWREVVGYYGCLAGGSDTSLIQTIKPLRITPSVISVNVETEGRCGGQHPDYSESPINLDAKTGKPLTLEDVLWVGQGKPLHYEELNDDQSQDALVAYSEYRTKELAPWLVEQLRKLHPDQIPGSDENCAYGEVIRWQRPTWYFTEKGIRLEPYFSHAEAPCGHVEWSVLPYSLVKQHPGGVALQLP